MAHTEDDFRSAIWVVAVFFVVGGCNLLLCGSCQNVTISRSKESLQLTNTDTNLFLSFCQPLWLSH